MTSEAELQQQVRLEAARRGTPLWRNNNGACFDETGRLIRYGLGNDSAKLSKVWKSSDLIGIYPVMITPAHVGMTLGVFYAAEVKHPGWHLTPGDKRAQAQSAFGQTVIEHGGIFRFLTSTQEMP